jgi:hypothetical protein
MSSDMVLDRVLVHAVLYADGTCNGQSVVTRYIDGSFSISPYLSEISDTSFSNAIAVIAPSSAAIKLREFAANTRTIPNLISAIKAYLANKIAITDPMLHIIAPC